MPRTNKNTEELRAANRLYQKERYKRIKNNPELYKIQKEKDRRKYEEQKKKKIKKSITEMSRREQKAQREKWRKNTKKYLENKKSKLEQVHIEESHEPNEVSLKESIDPLSSIQSKVTSKKVRKMRYKMEKEKKQAQRTIAVLQAENRKLRRKIFELEHAGLVHNSVEVIERSAEAPEVLNSVVEVEPKNLKRNIKNIKKPRNIDIVQKFYESDLNSYPVPGKKQFIKRLGVRKPKRFLSDTLRNLYKKIQIVYPELKISYPTFCRNRPFNVCFPKNTRDTCLCRTHVNMQLLITALHKAKIIKEHNASQVVSAVCCDEYNINCLSRQCESCKQRSIQYLEFDNNRHVVYYEWVTKRESCKSITIKSKLKESPYNIILKFEKVMPIYLTHLRNIAAQHQTIRDLKRNLTISEAIIHCDWSENYSLKYTEEIQSLHFGGSRAHVSLHTSVIYICDSQTGITTPRAFCTVSESMDHTSAAIWAHLMPLLRYIQKNCPLVSTIHFLSDSPSSQYRNKFIFYIISKLHVNFNQIQNITWNYTEAGHGKGAPDGVGGALKTSLDRLVNYGHDIGNFTDFLTAVKKCSNNIQIEVVTQDEINEFKSLIPHNVPIFKGTMKLHQIFWDSNASVMAARSLSCFFCQYVPSPCMHGKHLGFIEVLNNPGIETAPKKPVTKKIIPESKKITVLSEIKLNVQDFASLSSKLRLEKPIPFVIPKKKAYNVSSGNIGKDFEDMIEATSISREEPTPSTSNTQALWSETVPLNIFNALPAPPKAGSSRTRNIPSTSKSYAPKRKKNRLILRLK